MMGRKFPRINIIQYKWNVKKKMSEWVSEWPDGISPAADHEKWQAIFLDKLDTFAVSTDSEVKTAEPVSSERVRSALEDNRRGLERLHHFANDRHENTLVRVVVHAIAKRDVYSIIFAFASANILQHKHTHTHREIEIYIYLVICFKIIRSFGAFISWNKFLFFINLIG